MRTLVLTVAYDGTDYVGWQVQPNGPSVQVAIEIALEKLLGHPVRVTASGRTDSGVHAIGQVVGVSTASKIPARGVLRGLTGLLPDDITVRSVRDAVGEFHATYDTVRKRYRYLIHNVRVADPFTRRYAWQVGTPLRVEAMRDAAAVLVGRHDFRCFESQWPNRASSVRTVEEISLGRCDHWGPWLPTRLSDWTVESADGDFVWMEIVADGFLYNMVRAIMGTLERVGRGFWTADDVERILREGDRSSAGSTAPAHGLYLAEVEYPEGLFVVDPVADSSK